MKLLEFLELRQMYNYDCAVTALQSVLAYYNIDARGDKLMKSMKTNKEGTLVANIIKTSKKYGLKYKAKQMTIEEIKKYLDKNIPVIIVLQAWSTKKNINWEKNWTDGHYVVAIGYDAKKIYFEDPSSFKRTYLTYNELEKRWHDIDANGKKYINFGIALYGKKPAFRFNKFIPME